MNESKQQLGGTSSTSSPSFSFPKASREAEERVLPSDVIGRKRPARGALISISQPTIVFVTVCAEKRSRWIAQKSVQESLEQVWGEADTWLVGSYLLMPDHLHLFCAPRDLNFTFQRW